VHEKRVIEEEYESVRGDHERQIKTIKEESSAQMKEKERAIR